MYHFPEFEKFLKKQIAEKKSSIAHVLNNENSKYVLAFFLFSFFYFSKQVPPKDEDDEYEDE